MTAQSTPKLPGHGKVALVTGASRGLGAATAARLAREGYFVLINTNRSRARAEALLQGIVADGHEGALVHGDASTVAGVKALLENADAALAAAGRAKKLDVLVANAGVNQGKPFAEVTEDDFDALFDLNVKGVFFLVQQAVPRMNDGGRIITLGSGLSRVANPIYAAYSATKGAIDVLTRVWAKLLGPRGITVNTIAPGAIDTDMNKGLFDNPALRDMVVGRTALARVGQADDIGDAVAFLAGPDARWITGQRIEASGGYQL